MMKRISLEEYLRQKWNMTMKEYLECEDEEKIEKILDGYDHIKSIPEKGNGA